MVSLSNAIGRHQLSLNESAMRPKELVAPDAVHYDLVKKIALNVYRANRCFHINAPIDRQRTFDALGTIQGELLQSDRTDIDQMNLVHEIGIHCAEFFDSRSDSPAKRVRNFEPVESAINLRRSP